MMLNIPYLSRKSPEPYGIDTTPTMETSSSTVASESREYDEEALPLSPSKKQQQQQNVASSSPRHQPHPLNISIVLQKREENDDKVENSVQHKYGCIDMNCMIRTLYHHRSCFSIFVVVALFIMTGSTGYLFTQYLRMFGLRHQIQKLELEVNRLSNEISILAKENNRYEMLNDQFNATIDTLALSNVEFNQSNILYQYLNQQFKNTTIELNITNQHLQEQLIIFRDHNEMLQESIHQIVNEKNQLQLIQYNLERENRKLQTTTTNLTNEINLLMTMKEQLNSTILSLTEQVHEQMNLNSELHSLNHNLTTLVSFLNSNDYFKNQSSSYEMVSSYLTQQITINRNLILKALEMMYIERVDNWDCLFYDTFRSSLGGSTYSYDLVSDDEAVVITKNVSSNRSAVASLGNSNNGVEKTNNGNNAVRSSQSASVLIDASMLPMYMGYVDQRLLSGLCLDVTNLQQYLIMTTTVGSTCNNNTNGIHTKSIDDLTIDQFISGVYLYVNDALAYYFPSGRWRNEDDHANGTTSTPISSSNTSATINDGAGLTPTDWIDANYDCRNLPISKRYTYQAS